MTECDRLLAVAFFLVVSDCWQRDTERAATRYGACGDAMRSVSLRDTECRGIECRAMNDATRRMQSHDAARLSIS